MFQKRAIVMAGGKGTRMKSALPKVLVPVLGVPMINYVLDALREAGVKEIIVVVGYQAELVKKALADQKDLRFVEQKQQLGTGHAVMVCRKELARYHGPIFVIAGDNPMIQANSVKALFNEFESRSFLGNVSGILGTICKKNPFGLGRILRDPSGNFVGIVEEKDATERQRLIQEINMSYYIFDTGDLLETLDDLQTNNSQNEYYITDIPRLLLGKGKKVYALPILKPVESLGVNTTEELALVEETLKTSLNRDSQNSSRPDHQK